MNQTRFFSSKVPVPAKYLSGLAKLGLLDTTKCTFMSYRSNKHVVECPDEKDVVYTIEEGYYDTYTRMGPGFDNQPQSKGDFPKSYETSGQEKIDIYRWSNRLSGPTEKMVIWRTDPPIIQRTYMYNNKGVTRSRITIEMLEDFFANDNLEFFEDFKANPMVREFLETKRREISGQITKDTYETHLPNGGYLYPDMSKIVASYLAFPGKVRAAKARERSPKKSKRNRGKRRSLPKRSK